MTTCEHPADRASADALLRSCPDCGAECSGTQIGDDDLCYDDGCPLHALAGDAECEYCGATVPHLDTTPASDDYASWARLGADHEPDCEWIATHAYRIDDPNPRVTISGVTDLHTWVCNANPAGVYGLIGADPDIIDRVVAALQAADHPDWGANWGRWLEEHADSIATDVATEVES